MLVVSVSRYAKLLLLDIHLPLSLAVLVLLCRFLRVFRGFILGLLVATRRVFRYRGEQREGVNSQGTGPI